MSDPRLSSGASPTEEEAPVLRTWGIPPVTRGRGCNGRRHTGHAEPTRWRESVLPGIAPFVNPTEAVHGQREQDATDHSGARPRGHWVAPPFGHRKRSRPLSVNLSVIEPSRPSKSAVESLGESSSQYQRAYGPITWGSNRFLSPRSARWCLALFAIRDRGARDRGFCDGAPSHNAGVPLTPRDPTRPKGGRLRPSRWRSGGVCLGSVASGGSCGCSPPCPGRPYGAKRA